MRAFRSIIVVVLAFGSATSARGVGLYWNDGSGIHRWLSSQPIGSPALFETFETRGLAVDPANAQLWWSDILPLGSPLPGGVIRTGSTKGGDITDVVMHLTSPAGVALDARRGRIYWSDLGDVSNASAIFSANLDGSDVQKLVSDVFISEIAGIALDPIHDKLYFTYVNPLIDSLLAGGIARADLDGSNLEVIVGGQGKPIGIAVDAAGGGIYWADAMSISPAGGDGEIKAADLDGDNKHVILGGLNVPYGVALDVAEQYVYWTDMGTGKIQRTVMSGALPYFQDVLTGLPSSTAIVMVPTLPGDYNGDGSVDAADYVLWRKTDGTLGGFDTWRTHFGQAAGSASLSNAEVPEPRTHLPLIIGALFAFFSGRKVA
jgi:sugar lactone lactonase YvrE